MADTHGHHGRAWPGGVSRFLWSHCAGPGDGFVSRQTEPPVSLEYAVESLCEPDTLSGGAQLPEGSGVTAWSASELMGAVWGRDFQAPQGFHPEHGEAVRAGWELAPRILSGREHAGPTGRGVPPAPARPCPAQTPARGSPAGCHLPDGLRLRQSHCLPHGTWTCVTALNHILTVNDLIGRVG